MTCSAQPCPSVAVTTETHLGCVFRVFVHSPDHFISWSCRKIPFLRPFFYLDETSGKSRAWPLEPPERSSSSSFSLCFGALAGWQGAKDWGGTWGPRAAVLTSVVMAWDWVTLCCGHCLCVVGCWAAPLASTRWMPVAPLQLWQPKMSLDFTRSPLGEKPSLVENHCPRGWTLWAHHPYDTWTCQPPNLLFLMFMLSEPLIKAILCVHTHQPSPKYKCWQKQ